MSINKNKRVRLTTPAGVAKYPYLSNPDTQFNAQGEFKTTLLLDPNEYADFLAELDALADKAVVSAVESLEKQGKKAHAKQVQRQEPYREEYDSEGEPTGLVEVRFKSKAKITTRDGREMDLRPSLFDALGKPIDPKDVVIYGGSVIKVNFTPRAYYVSATKLAGVTLQLNAVQVIELVTGGSGGSASSFGFDTVEDGFDITEFAEVSSTDADSNVNDDGDDSGIDFDTEEVDF